MARLPAAINGVPNDYTQLITSENQQPNFLATVALTANGIADITALIQQLPMLFDLDAAIGAQLDVVGEWVGISRVVNAPLTVGFFGFADDSTALGFGEVGSDTIGGQFIELGESSSASTTLPDAQYRFLLQAKIIENGYPQNLSPIAELESAIEDLTSMPCTFFDPGDRVVMILFSGALDPVTTALLTSYDVLPRPAGTRYQVLFPLTGFTWSTAGTATGSGATVSKATGSNAWDSSAWVAQPAAHAYVSWTVASPATATVAGGLATNPSGSPNYPSLTFGIAIMGGLITVIESGISKGTFGAPAVGDTLAVYYDGNNAVYLHNGIVIRSVSETPGTLAPMFCLYSVGSQIQNISISTG